MKNWICVVLILFFGQCRSIAEVDHAVSDSTLAFPGAEGFGKYTSGGRGGKIFYVTTLNDNGTGSLREAVESKETRTILFAVSGTIELKSSLTINHGNLTIAGQSAPGDGICLRNYPLIVSADNVIIRYIRLRLGDESVQEADAFSGTKGKQNIIIDHCSISWATDECASFYKNRNFTLQWCIISESLNQSVHQKGDHGYGGIWGGQKASFHHNLLAHHTSRLPRFSGSSTTPNSPDELVDFRNNVIYNWASNNTYGGERGRYNVVNNYYKPGPATGSKKMWIINPSQPYGKFFIQGNCLYKNSSITSNNSTGIKADHLDSLRVDIPFTVTTIHNESAEQAYEQVLKRAGASLKRDAVDERIVREVMEGTASMGKNKNGIIDSQNDVGGWPILTSLQAPMDKDGDGIPDDWERKNRLDENDTSDGAVYSVDKNFTNLESYLNSIVRH